MTGYRNGCLRNGRQRGVSAVEFAIIATLFFTLLLGIMEFGRFMYLWNTVQEVTRKAAREAAVRDFTTDVPAIQHEAIFQTGSTVTVGLPGGGEVTNLQVAIQYLNAAGTPIAAADMPGSSSDNIGFCLSNNATSCIRFVKASICNLQNDGVTCNSVSYSPMISLFPFLAINIPRSSVVMPAESLGYP